MSGTAVIITIAVVVLLLGGWIWVARRNLRPVPPGLKPGKPLPDFEANSEQGEPLQASGLHGSPAVILFVRGNWCPFCSAQVQDLARHYKEIAELGARIVLLTPKPLETTRRVAEFFEVDFDFWLDEGLVATRQLGLLHEAGVPGDYGTEYGRDTVWPTALVVDAAGIIRYTELSKHISDRPDPELLLREIRKTLRN